MLQQYQAQIQSGKLINDVAQQHALNYLTRLQEKLVNQKPCSGAYLYGPVGRGKSMLMDLFFSTLDNIPKQRLHFHHFMALVHKELNQLQGAANPLQLIADTWANKTKVLCFDEFFVSDIGDAMIMARLFEHLFKNGLVLVTTSNCQPDHLYRNGLQRDRFLPTIELLKQHCELMSVHGHIDHRFNHGFDPSYIFIEDPRPFDDALKNARQHCTSFKQVFNIDICNRQVATLCCASNLIAFDFMQLCSAPRATADYMYLAQNYPVIFVKNVPQMGVFADDKHTVQGIEDGYKRAQQSVQSHQLDDEARRFIALVDEYYDQHCLVVMHCAVELQLLYVGKQLAFEFERTKSRLVEMQNWSITERLMQ
ncbi:cell division protein ZapE [Pseudoalteromonas sp. MMG005]|uniref:cell division protein ZapE n=1 Tax=Pseudoalteromonas sp. MMG005 TaxID=2822682 RepID=UPI001B3A78B6|nr:cell division protein ZapE [Pseudoalteromonas sp. MMG005]MBQ4846784.1 AFG1 family ATPase [Pseudoalteromonas sp. MMG005]